MALSSFKVCLLVGVVALQLIAIEAQRCAEYQDGFSYRRVNDSSLTAKSYKDLGILQLNDGPCQNECLCDCKCVAWAQTKLMLPSGTLLKKCYLFSVALANTSYKSVTTGNPLPFLTYGNRYGRPGNTTVFPNPICSTSPPPPATPTPTTVAPPTSPSPPMNPSPSPPMNPSPTPPGTPPPKTPPPPPTPVPVPSKNCPEKKPKVSYKCATPTATRKVTCSAASGSSTRVGITYTLSTSSPVVLSVKLPINFLFGAFGSEPRCTGNTKVGKTVGVATCSPCYSAAARKLVFTIPRVKSFTVSFVVSGTSCPKNIPAKLLTC